MEHDLGGRAITRGGLELYSPTDALEVVERARKAGVRVLGIDGFFLTEEGTQPSLEHSLDLSASAHQDTWADAAAFLRQLLGADMYFEVVLD